MTQIRPATFEDLSGVIALGKLMHHTSNFKTLEFDARHFGENLVRLISSDQHNVLLAVNGADIAGGILCGVSPGLSSKDLVAYELGFYIAPQYRGTTTALRLLKAYRQWAKNQGAKRITAGNSAGAPDSGYVKLLTRSGFERTGSLMYSDL